MTNERTISVVIPTYQRHEEVIRAIRSALSQTLPPLEVIVVNDGPDAGKARLIGELNEPSVRFLEAPRKRNASATRNFGIAHAKGNWIALLDDDDVWRPNKLALQFCYLDLSGHAEAILSAYEQVHVDGRPSRRSPSRPVPFNTPADEVLFIFHGIHTSTILAPRQLFLDYPMDEGMPIQEDWSWVLKAGRDMPIVVGREVVCDRFLVYGMGLTRPGDFEYCRAWYEDHKSLMGPASRVALLSGSLSRKAAYDRKFSAVIWLFRELIAIHRVSLTSCMKVVRPWIFPFWMRRWIKTRILR